MTGMPGAAPRPLSLIAATFTAFAGNGDVDLAPIEVQAARLAEDGVHGAFVCGSSGEGTSLTSAERVAVAGRWCEVAPPGLRIIVHVGHTSLPEARALAERAQRDGAHAVAAVAPFYFLPGDVDELVACCAEVAAAAPRIPFLYYHIPERTGIRLPMPEFLRAARARIPNFGGIKLTDTDLVQAARVVEAADEGEGVEIFFGADKLLLHAMLAGIRGAVGTSYSCVGPLALELGEAFAAGDLPRAKVLQARAREVIDTVQRHGGLAAWKALASARVPGLHRCRLPLRALESARRDDLLEKVAALGAVG